MAKLNRAQYGSVIVFFHFVIKFNNMSLLPKVFFCHKSTKAQNSTKTISLVFVIL